MKKRKPVEEMVRVVRAEESLLAQGKPVDEVCRQLGVSDSNGGNSDLFPRRRVNLGRLVVH